MGNGKKKAISGTIVAAMTLAILACGTESQDYTVSYIGIKSADVSSGVSVHDPSILQVDDTYYIFGSHMSAAKSTDLLNWEKVGVGKQISNLYIVRMKNGYTLDTVQVLLTTPDYDWERHGFWVNEGPAVIKRNGRVFVTYSASDTGIHYCMGMLSADEDSDLLDPLSWKKDIRC